MPPPANAPRNPRQRDAIGAIVVASAVAVVLLILVPGLAWWIYPIVWLIVVARVLQGLARLRRADSPPHGRDRRAGARAKPAPPGPLRRPGVGVPARRQ